MQESGSWSFSAISTSTIGHNNMSPIVPPILNHTKQCSKSPPSSDVPVKFESTVMDLSLSLVSLGVCLTWSTVLLARAACHVTLAEAEFCVFKTIRSRISKSLHFGSIISESTRPKLMKLVLPESSDSPTYRNRGRFSKSPSAAERELVEVAWLFSQKLHLNLSQSVRKSV